MPDNPIILDIQGEDGFTLDMQDSDGLDFEAQPFSKGDPGKSAYQSAVDCGFEGTEEEWLASLVGPQGPPGTTDWDGITNKPSINGVTLGGSQTSADLGIVTTPDWNEDDSTELDYIQNRPNVRAGSDEDGSSVNIGVLDENTVTGKYSLVAGRNNEVTAGGAVAFGRYNKSTRNFSFTAGYSNTASGSSSVAFGRGCTSSDSYSFAEGYNTISSGLASHAEGHTTQATYGQDHAEGYNTIASGGASHAEGHTTQATAYQAHSEGYLTVASGSVAHAEGYGTVANHSAQHVFGKYNITDTSENAGTEQGNYVEIVGNGTADDARSNARTLDWDGNEVLSGKLTVGSAPTENMDVATKQYVDNAVLNAAVNANECLTFWHASDVI